MSELSRFEETVPGIDCGAVILSYSQSHLEAELNSLADIVHADDDYTKLIEPSFNHPIAKHIVDASFGLKYHNEDEFYAIGYITYDISQCFRRQRYRTPATILNQIEQHLKSTIDFDDYTFSAYDNELRLELNDQDFSIIIDMGKQYPNNNVRVTVESEYSVSRPIPDDIYPSAAVWAQVCDFIVRLGTRRRTSLQPEQITHATLGQIADFPSDIELALVYELEMRRRSLGITATLPEFDEDIMPNATQLLSKADNLSPDEIQSVACTIINEKRADYARSNKDMADITQGDIIEALTKIVKARKSV